MNPNTNPTVPVSLDALAVGRSSTNPFLTVFETRDPNSGDINYPIQQRWYNTTKEDEWILTGFSVIANVKTAIWQPISQSAIAVTETLTGNTGGPVGVDGANNINVVGDTTTINIVGNPATHTLTASTTGSVATLYTENTGTATPSGGNLNVLGTNGITTTGSGSTITISSSNGQIMTGVIPDAHTAPGTSPVVPNSSGDITVTGGQVAAGTTTNIIQTNSLAANTYTIQIQRSQAVASSTIGDNGVSHFSNTQFTVDGNGFVQLKGGTNPAIQNITRQVFTSSGTYTPTTNMVKCDIEVVGGGGGGGGAAAGSASLANAAGGGGGGGYARGLFTAASIGVSQTVTIGSAGTGGPDVNNSGTTAGTTSVGVLISATGGVGAAGGTGGQIGNGGAGGVGSGGDYQTTGDSGGNGALYNDGIGTFSAGGGVGGSTFFGGGANFSNGTGATGNSYGGGGGGGSSNQSGVNAAGGNGFAGIVIITEYIA